MARFHAHRTLLFNLYSIATVHDSPLSEPTDDAMILLLVLLNSFNDLPAIRLGRLLLQIGWQAYTKLFEKASDSERTRIIDAYFSNLYGVDVRHSLELGEPLLISDADVRKFARSKRWSPNFFINPDVFIERALSIMDLEMMDDFFYAHLMSVRRVIAQIRVAFNELTRKELEKRCSHLHSVLRFDHEWADRSAASWSIGVARVFRALNSRHVVLVAQLVSDSIGRFPDSKLLLDLAKSMNEQCDAQIHLILTMASMTLDRWTREGYTEPIVLIRFAGEFHFNLRPFNELPGGWGYLSGFMDRYPESEGIIMRLLRIMKHLAYRGRHIAEPAQQLQEACTLRVMAKEVEDQFATVIESSPSQVQEDELQLPPDCDPTRGRSPSVSDFSRTLEDVLYTGRDAS
ncbi:hypothetical protein BT69DRAFT_410448 [Atractiella rhizophila]|nr:hypothetical protein BT69DRAFT_410448 [Atractiella rhizophila]